MPINTLSVREQIVATASRLFLKQGYNQTGINQIIEEAGIAKASLYYHFQSKEDLCVEYLQCVSKKWSDGLEAYLKDVTNPYERIIRTFDYRMRYMKETQFNGCSNIRIMTEVAERNSKIHKQAIAMKEVHRSFFQKQVSQIQHISKIQKTDLTNTLLLLFDGGSIEASIYKNEAPLVTAKNAVIRMLDYYIEEDKQKLQKNSSY